MITYIKINGFKSFHNFEMEFTPLTVIAGANASGKSNLFDALSLLSRLAETDLSTAFNEQRGNPIELFTLYGEEYASEMEFVVEMLLDKSIETKWGEKTELKFNRLRYSLVIKRIVTNIGLPEIIVDSESLVTINTKKDSDIYNLWSLNADKQDFKFLLSKKNGKQVSILYGDESASLGGKTVTRTFAKHQYRQTALSIDSFFHLPHIFAVKEEMSNWKFLQLNPKDLREPTKIQPGFQDTITSSGKNLAAALYRISFQDKFTLTEVSTRLLRFIPSFIKVIIRKDEANQQFIISLQDNNGKEFSSRLLSEGTLRVLALCILEFDEEHKGLLCFEEPENGIHPSRLKAMARLLKDFSTNVEGLPLRQVIVNTHSPILVGELIKWQEDKNISVGLSFLKATITDIGDKRVILRTTGIAFPNGKGTTKEKENLRKFTMHQIKEYLETADTENALSVLLNE